MLIRIIATYRHSSAHTIEMVGKWDNLFEYAEVTITNMKADTLWKFLFVFASLLSGCESLGKYTYNCLIVADLDATMYHALLLV